MEKNYKPRVHKWKKDEVQKVKDLASKYKIIAVANLETLPASTYQIVRKNLRGKVEFLYTRKRFIIKALEDLKIKNYENIIKNIKGVPLLLFTNENPFELYKIVSKNQTPAFAKAGQDAPEDISVDAGPTNFPAGPMIGEFGQLGLKTEVKEGKISVREGKTLVKKGDVISDKVAAFLQKLGVQPMKIGMNILLVYENGDILTKEVLAVSEEEYIAAIQNAHRESMNLALNACYLVSDTVTILIKKAYLEAKAVAKEGKILTKDTVGDVLAKAEAEASNVQKTAGI